MDNVIYNLTRLMLENPAQARKVWYMADFPDIDLFYDNKTGLEYFQRRTAPQPKTKKTTGLMRQIRDILSKEPNDYNSK